MNLFEVRPVPLIHGLQAFFVDAHRPPLLEMVRLHMSLARGSLEPTVPIAIREGARITPESRTPELHPILWTVDGCPLVTSDFLEVIANATGWRSYEVTIAVKDSRPLLGYRGLAITGRCGRVVPNRDAIEWTGGRRFYVGASIDPESHDGSDLCMPVRGAGLLVGDRIAKQLAALALPNSEIVHLSLKRYPADVVDRMDEYHTSMFSSLSDAWLWDPSTPRRDHYAEIARQRAQAEKE